MRNPVIYLVLLATLGLVACEQKVDVAAEEEAIKAAVQHEMDAFRTRDYEEWSTSWVHAPYIIHARFTGEPVGWDSVSAGAKNAIETWETLDPDKNRFDELTASNFDIHLDGNIAFVICDDSYTGISNGEPFSGTDRVLRYLVKKDGEWKLVAVFNA